MEKTIQILFNEGLLTKIECRSIISLRELDARKVVLYNIITSKYKQDPMTVMEMLEILTSEAQEEADPKSALSFDVNQEMNVHPLNETGKNPLLIDTVIHNVFKFLPLNEIQICGLVNHQWNKIAEPFLRERGVIHFKPEILKPLDFIHAQAFSLPDLPFSHFKFSNDMDNDQQWQPSEIQHFFDKWGHNIKSVEIWQTLENKKMGISEDHDVPCWITKAKNLKKLMIRCDPLASDLWPYLGIRIDALAVVESISLTRCAILWSDKENSLRMAPREIKLKDVSFELGGQSESICLNDSIDFGRCFKIYVKYKSVDGRDLQFDMSSVVLNAKSVHFKGICIKNWRRARGKVDSLFLCEVDLIERNNLEFKNLTFKWGKIDMSAIPLTIEKLRFAGHIEISGDDYFPQLPNLTFLSLSSLSQRDLDLLISRFTCCANLVEVELVATLIIPTYTLTLDVDKIPQSVKKLKIRCIKINTSGLQKLQLDSLIIEESSFDNFFKDVTKLLSEKILTVNVLVISCLNVINLHTSDIIRFVQSNMGKTIQKLVVGVDGRILSLNKNVPFKGSALSQCVGKESNYYQFTNKVGEAITRQEFLAYRNISH